MKNTKQKDNIVRSISKQWSNFRVSYGEKKYLAEQAEFVGLSLSEYMRRRIFGGRPIISQSDEITVRELRRIGGLLKHNFETIRQATNNDFEQMQTMNELFKQLSACITKISMPQK